MESFFLWPEDLGLFFLGSFGGILLEDIVFACVMYQNLRVIVWVGGVVGGNLVSFMESGSVIGFWFYVVNVFVVIEVGGMEF
jgi:hypothetical protein